MCTTHLLSFLSYNIIYQAILLMEHQLLSTNKKVSKNEEKGGSEHHYLQKE